jgi:AraC-like DNA-binding protein/HAMP domain-containing protein
MVLIRRLYRNLKLRNKLILMFSLLVLLSLTLFSMVSIALFERITIKNENRAILEGLEFFRSSLDNHLASVENFSSSIIFEEEIQESMRQELDSLSREERLEHYNRVYRRLYDNYNNFYGISAIFLSNRYGNSFRVDTRAGNYAPDNWIINNRRGWERAEIRGGAPSWELLENPWGQKVIGMFRTIRSMSNLNDHSGIGRSAIIISPSIMEGYFSKNRYSEGIYGIIDYSGSVYVSSNAVDDDMFTLGEVSGSKGYYSKIVRGTKYLISFIRDSRTGWVFAYAIDSNIPLRDVKYVRQASVLVFAVTMLMVVGLSFMVSSSVTKPLREMVRLLKEMEKGNLSVRFQGMYEDEMGILGRSFNRMVDKIRQGIPLKREKYFRSLLMENLTPDQQEQARQDMDIAFTGEAYQVVLLRAQVEIDEDTNRRIESIISAFESSSQTILSNTLRSGEYCVLSNRCAEDTRDMFRRLVVQVREGCGVELLAFSGKSYGSRHFIRHSYEEALELTRYQLYRTEELEWLDWSFVDSNTWGSDYPEHLENRLLHSAQMEALSECRAILDETLAFFKDKSSKPSVMHAFVLNIYLQLYKSVMKRGLTPDEFFSQSFGNKENMPFVMESVETTFDRLLGVIGSFAALSAHTGEKDISISIRTALEIIKDEYGNPDLGVDFVAGRVHLNENYFSKLFKKEMGISFVEYVASIRLERAKELLSGSTMKIKDISGQVGFANPNYFGIWFKENTGVTPSQFRNQS